MNFDSYITSETKTAISLPLTCPPPPYGIKGFRRFKLKSLFKKKAFTLAETLITLTIIGVVAALTIPTLMAQYQKHTYVVGLKKAYSNLQNAMKMIPITEGCPAGDYDCANFFTGNDDDSSPNSTLGESLEILSKNFKTVKEEFKYDNTLPECQVIGRALNVNTVPPCFVTPDGMVFANNVDDTLIAPHMFLYLNVDINGIKGPNKQGRDIFGFRITKTNDFFDSYGVPQASLIPMGADALSLPIDSCSKALADSNRGIGCTNRVLREDAMNY